LNIAGREIGVHQPPYIVAEISGNHCGDIKKAEELIFFASQCGADAVKLQAYTPDTITLDSQKDDFIIKDGPWKGQRLYDLYSRTHTPFEWFPRLFEVAAGVDITIFASVFDETSVDMLHELDCPAYKIASMEITDIPLIEYAAATEKPVIISTGMANASEIAEAEDACLDEPLLLHCVSAYPARVEDAKLYQLRPGWGVSDHSTGIEVPIAATAMGAVLIEKHLCLDEGDSEDLAFSLRPYEFRSMVMAVQNIWKSLHPRPGHHRKDTEKESRQFRRSLYAVADIKKGESFTDANVRSIRPSYGLPPKMLSYVLQHRAACDIEAGTGLKPHMLTSALAPQRSA
jgi:pseudaminic acid synthase